jgi:hypothetical protein
LKKNDEESRRKVYTATHDHIAEDRLNQHAIMDQGGISFGVGSSAWSSQFHNIVLHEGATFAEQLRSLSS